jgi:hypothetical protein
LPAVQCGERGIDPMTYGGGDASAIQAGQHAGWLTTLR